MCDLAKLKIHIYADGADKEGLLRLYADPLIKGLTTNPTLMHQAGITDFEAFAREVLATVKDKPISFEVFDNSFPDMIRQARKIASWQGNVYVKIPVTDVFGRSCAPVINELSKDGIKLNITAMLTRVQIEHVLPNLYPGNPVILSIFAGRIADAGRDPELVFIEAKKLISDCPYIKLLWGSVREIYNIVQAERCGCDIITVQHSILKKAREMMGMDLTQLSLQTVQMFHNDAEKAGFKL